ncbi:VIT1/CCC1 transporter family protein [Entomospira entomophila]|uniref:Rubrerythrin family protein n=1 Tax=Entomospira entomophila TaxID=2719988 RepID=A0A968G932_9SPIO|nr:VIT1/CCC1 transporter family protein [Entomospira entomophilus]NIZ40075.1 rubrerythrin family protein [Entomospira entomophilus]WDI35636.1 VIT1/CCC1 transporter family protein [Entomospira entomophilus]
MNINRAYRYLQHEDPTHPKYHIALICFIYALQKRELFEAHVYSKLAKMHKDDKNKEILLQVAEFDFKHQATLETFTKKKASVSQVKVWLFGVLATLLGYTFVAKMMEKKLSFPLDNFMRTLLVQYDDHFVQWFHEEKEHEYLLLQTLDEERLRYVSSMVLGLNDALIEITATLAGFSLSMTNNHMIGVSGLILGISATLSMASSEYLSNRSENNPEALKASILCGITYLIVSLSLVAPFFLFPTEHKSEAILSMLLIALLIIIVFNLYLSVTKEIAFKKRFIEMFLITSIITAISFSVGFLADRYLNTTI